MKHSRWPVTLIVLASGLNLGCGASNNEAATRQVGSGGLLTTNSSSSPNLPSGGGTTTTMAGGTPSLFTTGGSSSPAGGSSSPAGGTATASIAGGTRSSNGSATEVGGRSTQAGGTAGKSTVSGTSGATSVNPSKVLTVSGRRILDTSGAVFIPRGPEFVGGAKDNIADIDAIADSGANSMRLLLVLDEKNGLTPSDFDAVIGRAVDRGLVIWLSLFTWDDANNRKIASALGGGNLQGMADYMPIWQRQWLFDLVDKYKHRIVIDAMQEFIQADGVSGETPEGRNAWVDAAKKQIVAFRTRGYTEPLEIMSNYQGRDLYAIVSLADQILAADSVLVNGQAQTMFGWQAYWTPDWYYGWQGGLLRGQSTSASQAIQLYVSTRSYPIMVGLLYGYDVGDYNLVDAFPACADNDVGWLWWTWNDLKGSTSLWNAVIKSQDGFLGATRAK